MKEKLSLLKILLLKFKISFKSKIFKINIIIKIKFIKKKIFILLNLNLKISLEAKDVIYINKINIPPIKIKNKQ